MLSMQITGLDKEEVRLAALEVYKDSYIDVDVCDLFLSGIDKGKIIMDCIDHPVYVNTNYVYEDRLINGNQTRFKVTLTAFYVKTNKYEVIYDSFGKYFVAYKDDDKIKFIPYEDVYDLLKDQIHIVDDKKS